MASSKKRPKNSQQVRALRMQQIIAATIGIIVILSMIISMVAKY